MITVAMESARGLMMYRVLLDSCKSDQIVEADDFSISDDEIVFLNDDGPVAWFKRSVILGFIEEPEYE